MKWAKSEALADIKIDVIGYKKGSGVADTLMQDLTQTEVDLKSVDASQYPAISLLAHLRTKNMQLSPELAKWQIEFDPVPDFIIAPESVADLPDSVLIGTDVQIDFDLYNMGQAKADSVTIQYEETNTETGRVLLAKRKILKAVAEDSSMHVSEKWPLHKKDGLRQLFITIDPDDEMPELSELNNSVSLSLFVKADTAQPDLKITFDDTEIFDGDLVSSNPEIVATIFDDSPQPLVDTTFVHVFLDGQRISFKGNEHLLQLNPVQSPDIKAKVLYKPVLGNGDHSLEYIISDPSENRIFKRQDFRVTSKLELRNVMNYPNPFRQETDFTFMLSQPANVAIKIYTIAGRLIWKFEETWFKAGFHQIHWSGLDGDGDEIANGVYIYKVLANSGDEKSEVLSKLVMMR